MVGTAGRGQKKPLALCVHPQLPPTTLPRHLPVAVLGHKAGCPLRKRVSLTHLHVWWEGPIPLHGHCHFLGGLQLTSQAPLGVSVQIQPQDGPIMTPVQHDCLHRHPPLSFPPSFFGVSLFLSLYFPASSIFPFPPLYFPIHLFIVPFPWNSKLSDPGRVNWLTVTRTLILGVTCSVGHSLLEWYLSVWLGTFRVNNSPGLFPHLQK